MSEEKKSKANIEVDTAVLHSAVILDGKTESTLNKAKTPTLKMFWHADGLIIESKKQRHIVPAAGVKLVTFK